MAGHHRKTSIHLTGQVIFGQGLNDLDAAFLLKDRRIVGNADFNRQYLPSLNEALQLPLFQHGPKLNGTFLGMKGTNAETLNELSFLFDSNGFATAGRMKELANIYAAPLWWMMGMR